MPDLSTMQTALLLIAIAVVAFLYSLVGHGGAAEYLEGAVHMHSEDPHAPTIQRPPNT